MAKGPDAGLRALMSKHLKPHGFWIQSIETGATSAGLPDTHVLGPTGTLWIECKKTDGWALKFEPHQISWWRRHAEWIRGFVAVRTMGVGSSEGTGDGLALYWGSQVETLAERGLRDVPAVLKFTGSDRRWDWGRVAHALADAEDSSRSSS